MPLLDGLTPGEIVLLVGGCLFFFALLIVFVGKSLGNKPVTGLLPFFAIPIVMIGFPTISAVKIGGEGVDIENQTAEVQKDPDNEASRKALESTLNDLKGRPFKNAETITKIARAEFALGQDAEAKRNVDKALESNPNLKTAQDLKTRIEATSSLSAATVSEKQPDNPGVKQQPATTGKKTKKDKIGKLWVHVGHR
jgi:hypothetical protein